MACGVRAQRYGEGEVKSRAMGAYCRLPQKPGRKFLLVFSSFDFLVLYEQGATSREHAATASGTAAGAQPPLVMA
jgi:hypothetical protein